MTGLAAGVDTAMDAELASDTAYVLTNADREMLEFERLAWRFAGAKESAIRDRFGVSTAVYYSRLVTLIARPEAEAYDPTEVRRQRRLRERRRDARRSQAAAQRNLP